MPEIIVIIILVILTLFCARVNAESYFENRDRAEAEAAKMDTNELLIALAVGDLSETQEFAYKEELSNRR